MENVNFFVQRTISWDDRTNTVRLIDQTLLPEKFRLINCKTVDSLVRAIKTMQIRGAPAIGVAGAMGVALSLVEGLKSGMDEKQIAKKIHGDAKTLVNARPTAVNLSWGVDRALAFIKEFPSDIKPKEEAEKLIAFVKGLADKDVEDNRKLASLGQRLIHNKSSVLTHCN